MQTVAPSSLVRSTRQELGALFRSATVPVIPGGRGSGTVLLGTGGLLGRVVAVLVHVVAWRGKVVDAKAGRLKNILTPAGILAVEADVYQAASWYDGKPCIVLDYSRRSFLARKVRDEIREVSPGVFLGLVFLGRRHILDFALDFTRRR
jgi:hypothetical protein